MPLSVHHRINAELSQMTSQLQQRLGERDGERELDRWFADAMRGGDRDALDAFLVEELRAHPHPITSLCLARPLVDVHVNGWDELAADLRSLEEREADAETITAVGVNLTMHCDPDGDDWGLEVSFYDDDRFPFSQSDIASINTEAAKTSTKWQGCFRDIGHSLTVQGLGRIYQAICDNERQARAWPQPGEPASVDSVADRLGGYFVTLRFHQALVRDARREGLPRPMVLLGGAHDISPHYEAAYACDTVHRDDGKAASIPTPEKPRRGLFGLFRRTS
jgi:hypothetical protein